MRSTLHLLLLTAMALPLAGCGVASSPTPAPDEAGAQVVLAETRSLEELLLEIPVAKEWPKLPDLTPRDLEEIFQDAQTANPDERIASVYLLNVFHSSQLEVRIAFEPYAVGERIRRYHTVFLHAVKQTKEQRVAEPPNRWTRDAQGPCEVNLAICPAWRSFTGGLPPLADEIAHLWFEPTLDAESLLALVDCVRDKIPDGDRIMQIHSGSDIHFAGEERVEDARIRGADLYEVWTVRGCSGDTFLIEHLDGRWTAEHGGGWIS